MSGADRDQDGVVEGRKGASFAKFEFLIEIAGEIVVPRELNRRTKRGVRLHENFAGGFAASSTPGYLSQELKRSFARSKIRQMQGQVGVDDSDKSDIGKMQTLGNHLCSHKTID